MYMETRLLVPKKQDCCACSACINKCPKGAISLVADEAGFNYPSINSEICINCNLCKKICAWQNNNVLFNLPKEVYAAVGKKNLDESTSGGVFGLIAERFIQDGGVVFGAVCDFSSGKPEVYHTYANNINDLKKLKGSKYVQSDVRMTFSEAKSFLDKDIKVLYSGTPCQIAGLKSYLAKEYKNLYTIDIICHGVPNQELFREYVRSLEKVSSSQITDFKFRDKQYGWGQVGSVVYNNKHKKRLFAQESSYFALFLKGYTYRENCYSCKYASIKRVSDITVGDYWGIEIQHPDFIKDNKIDVNRGCSCVLANTDKGQDLFEISKGDFIIQKSTLNKVLQDNEQLKKPTTYRSVRDVLISEYKKGGYIGVEKFFQRYYRPSMIMRLRLRLPSNIKKIYRKLKGICKGALTHV